ncbi:protocatechuate 3,4-dioxygenase subunit alpha [Acidisphaera sp. L21]|uniref:protocatechuate 3,4-dioxygenase subunit alpha n=1 Tax=Acidisphaera sp. L21 TaxID=1641851 RepID=UPI00131B03F4|nr:protocatechuate 3,4-dioxygenase subunit alpha [Acidisphaera sp. L21]
MTAATASQTIGPYWHLLEDKSWANLTRFGAEGERIALIGTITDGDGLPVGDACVELWQPSPAASPTWDGFGRAATDVGGNYCFVTLKPGPVGGAPGANTPQAPHVALTLFARGLLIHLQTRAYFDGDPLNESDPLLASLDPPRRATLVARPVGEQNGIPTWRMDIRLQGVDETVFLEI